MPEIGLTAQINHQFNMASSEYDYTATVTLQGSMASNNTELYCSVSSFTSQSNSIPANLTVIGKYNYIYMSITIVVHYCIPQPLQNACSFVLIVPSTVLEYTTIHAKSESTIIISLEMSYYSIMHI